MIALLLLISFLPQGTTFCSCIPLRPIDNQQYNSYDLIARGKVEKVFLTNFERTIHFAVETFYKGDSSQAQIVIFTPEQEGECGIIPKVGETWLLFAYKNGTNYRTDLCTRTKNMNPKAWDYKKEEITSDLNFLESKVKNNGR